MPRYALLAVLALGLSAAPAVAGPRDELLRVAPPDAALVVVVQNAREHASNLKGSPFAAWFPNTAIGKKLLGSAELKQLTEAGANIFTGLGTTPQTLLDEVLGDAVAFAYSPAPAGQPNEERAVFLVHPRKPEALAKLVEKLNELQTKGGEVKAVARREHAGGEYFERQLAGGGSHFYCFRGGVFAFSSSEADVKAVIDRDKATPPAAKQAPPWVARMNELGVADAAGVILVNPRALDAEVKAQVAGANPGTKRFLEKFAEVWAGLDAAAVYLTLDKHAEVGLALRFKTEKLPPDARKFLAGLREPGTAEYLIPTDALFGVAGHFRAADLIDLVAALAPIEAGKPGVKDWIARTVGPVVGRDNLPLILDSLGPNWAVWAVPPEKESFLPTVVAAVEVSGTGETRAKAEAVMLKALNFGFQTASFAYNATHTDQIELVEEKDPKTGAVVRSLVNEKGFPPGFRPSFAIQKGYLVLATNPEAIRRFVVPPVPAKQPAYRTLARFSGSGSRAYLQEHGAKLAKFLADLGAGDEATLKGHVAGLADVLELIDSADLIVRPEENGLRIAVRVNTAKPLKK
jgi:hypothetical protein